MGLPLPLWILSKVGTEVLVVPRRVMSARFTFCSRLAPRRNLHTFPSALGWVLEMFSCVKSHYATSRPRLGSRIYPEILCRQITSCVCVSCVERPLLLTSLILYALCFVLCRYLAHTSGICICRTQMFCF